MPLRATRLDRPPHCLSGEPPYNVGLIERYNSEKGFFNLS